MVFSITNPLKVSAKLPGVVEYKILFDNVGSRLRSATVASEAI
jgi:hypothetical protein